MKSAVDAYTTDGYNSPSIEGYKVTPALIECVKSDSWNPDDIDTDLAHPDAMAARRYWQSFQTVR
ncbi:hypothetical protein [Pelagicoccus sp. SDUM812005]|uniref:hypothetical protein n=1 Tax=Pelagicoccus sp. SDUM812005 TaxID=3041257 RepID=UPI00280F64B2|nr:hypothetical protein [Pelagicoccus sp. SDUM812005]MDQ8182291.1 hypothetical protein [Pelagicoccus sp. SDUM812005]